MKSVDLTWTSCRSWFLDGRVYSILAESSSELSFTSGCLRCQDFYQQDTLDAHISLWIHPSYSYDWCLNILGSAVHWTLTFHCALSCSLSPGFISDESFHLKLKHLLLWVGFVLRVGVSFRCKHLSFGVCEAWISTWPGCPFSCQIQQKPKPTTKWVFSHPTVDSSILWGLGFIDFSHEIFMTIQAGLFVCLSLSTAS